MTSSKPFVMSYNLHATKDSSNTMLNSDTPDEDQNPQAPIKRGPWLPDEDRKLMELVAVYGPTKWVRISSLLGSRTAKQCRERYHQNLKPSLNRSPITPEEGAYIEDLVKRYGKRWAEIARHLNGRSDNAIKNWWNGGANRRRRASAQANLQQEQYLHHYAEQQQQQQQQQSISQTVKQPIPSNAPPQNPLDQPILPPLTQLQRPAQPSHFSASSIPTYPSTSSSKLQPPVVLPAISQQSASFTFTQASRPPISQASPSAPLNSNGPSGITLPSLPSNLYSGHYDPDYLSSSKRRLLESRRHSAATIVTPGYFLPSPNSLSNSRNSSISFDAYSSNDSLTSNSASRRSSLADCLTSNASSASATFNNKPLALRKRNSAYSISNNSLKYSTSLHSISTLLSHSYNTLPNNNAPALRDHPHKDTFPPLHFNASTNSSTHSLQQPPLTLPPLASSVSNEASSFEPVLSLANKSSFECIKNGSGSFYSGTTTPPINNPEKSIFKSNFSFSTIDKNSSHNSILSLASASLSRSDSHNLREEFDPTKSGKPANNGDIVMSDSKYLDDSSETFVKDQELSKTTMPTEESSTSTEKSSLPTPKDDDTDRAQSRRVTIANLLD